MAFENLPGIFPKLADGNLQITTVNENPVVLILGTATSGPSESFYSVASISQAAKLFGRADGTLVKGMYETRAGGASNLALCRIGASPATLTGVGTGITITTVEKDNMAGLNYKMFWDDDGGQLKIWRVSDDLLVYDNNPLYPSGAIDENELSVTGTASGSPGDIGSLAVPVTLAAANGLSGATYTAGSDGILLGRMQLFEKLYQAYKVLENEDIDIVIPQNVYLDDANVQDMTTAEVTAVNTSAPWAVSSAYPTVASFYDVLGTVFAQEYQGEWYFWWDMDRDGVAEIYPAGSVGHGDRAANPHNVDMYGTVITSGDFYEANFGYQLGNFCYTQSENNAEMIGVIGMLPPVSWSLKDVSNWIGRAPTLTEDSAGNSVITTNGSGLLGNKWMAGRVTVGGTGVIGHIVHDVDGLASGGFIATEEGWPNGTAVLDRNDNQVDLGKYLSVVGSQAILANATSANSYAGTGASVYAGLVSALPANSAPSNKIQPGVRLPFRIGVSKLDDLAGAGYVMFQDKSKGVVVADAPTAARPDSDYRRLTTVRIVKASIDAVRAAGEPFLGEGIKGARLAALETAIDQALIKLQKTDYLQRYEKAVTATATQQVQGQADVELILVPAFELRQLTVYVSLAAQ